MIEGANVYFHTLHFYYISICIHSYKHTSLHPKNECFSPNCAEITCNLCTAMEVVDIQIKWYFHILDQEVQSNKKRKIFSVVKLTSLFNCSLDTEFRKCGKFFL